MDFYRAVQTLHEELRKIDQAIATIEALMSGADITPVRRRGRKSMSAEERKIVAQRMRNYWANRRSRNANTQAGSTS
ncbi:MAG TPA: hypothetical protein VFL57_08240 [Bryobacteraceae bacterium]|nr:hypothetical protein [Bryobacteraceae bacterium]